MHRNFPQLNESETEVLTIRPAKFPDDLAKALLFVVSLFIVHPVVSSSFFHVRSATKIKLFLSLGELEVVLHAFITSGLDYCNPLYVGVSQSSLAQLQLVQNAATGLLTGIRRTLAVHNYS